MATTECLERRSRNGSAAPRRGAPALPLLLVALACSSTPSTAPGGGPPGADWPRFGWDAGRSNAPSGAAGITAANVASLGPQQVAIDGAVDRSAIYLHGVTPNAATHHALFLPPT